MSFGGIGVAVGAIGVLVGGTRDGVGGNGVAGVSGRQALKRIAMITLEIVKTRPMLFNFIIFTPGRYTTSDVILPYHTDASPPFFVPRPIMLELPQLF